MKLARLVRTSSFRLTLLYAAITGTSFLVMFGVIMWSTSRFMKQQIDSGVAAELREIHTAAAGTSVKSLAPVIDSSIKELSGFHYVLQDADGERVAGNLPPLSPLPGIRDQPGGVRGARSGRRSPWLRRGHQRRRLPLRGDQLAPDP
ncbi:hypothetical protein ACFQGW_22385 [Xanthomonas theicola]|uniref:hypothetical protein n=1 Tax=Xanthomonas theicola TaxID=56464 RepID=UPI00361F6787